MTAGAAGGGQVEKALDDLISRLSKADSTAEVRAALIEARRLRNVTLRWGAIPPPPDARREMMTRVTDLVAKAGAAARSQPPPPSAVSAPPASGTKPTAQVPPSGPEITVERAPARALSPFGGQLSRPAFTPQAPPVADFRSNPAGGMTRPRVNGALAQPKARPVTSELLDDVAPPRAPPPPPSRKPAPEPPRNLSPMPAPVRSATPPPRLAAQITGAAARGLTPSTALSPLNSPIPSLKKEPSPLPAALRTSGPPVPPPKRGTAAGLRPIGGSSFGEPSPLPPPAGPPVKKAPTLEFEAPAQSPRPPSLQPRPSQPATPRVDPREALRAISSAPISRAPHRAHTIAGIPEANESFIEALRQKREPRLDSDEPPDFENVRARSNMPTAAPPPPASDAPRSTGAPPPLRRGASKGTLMMGSIGAEDALEALRGGRAPVFPQSFDDDGGPPSTKPSNPENLAVLLQSGSAPPPRRPSGTMPAAGGSAPPILAIPAGREGRLDGLSSAVSMPSMASVNPGAQRKPSSPTQIMGSTPSSVRPSAMPDRPLRTVISPGVTIVRPDVAQWQPHPVSPGVTIKLLFRDARSGVYTALVRLAPGSVLGRRRHTASEEMLLVSGIASVGSHEMRAGEYCRAEADTVHDMITTSSGCTFFLCGSEHDEFLDE